MAASAGATTSSPPRKPPTNPISLKRVESIISRSVAVFGLVFGAQTVPALIDQWTVGDPAWTLLAVTVIGVSLVLAFVASLLRRAVRFCHGLVAVIFLIVLVSWPFAVVDPAEAPRVSHWLYFLLTVATATAAIGFPIRTATVYLVAIPTIYGIIRLTPQGGGVTPLQAGLDSVYAIILGGAVMIIVTMLRQAAASVDTAASTALERYGHAVRQHATEVERVQVDSIVHDSVLTTLLSAARAYTPQAMDLAATMAGNAIKHLSDAAMVPLDDGLTVRLRDVSSRIASAGGDMVPAFELRIRDVGPRALPANAAEALISAATQAMVNSIQHAGSGADIRRWLSIRSPESGAIEVEIGDTGGGFSVDSVPTERLGVRVSILERVSNAGGTATLASTLGSGTVVTLAWPAVAPDSPFSPEALVDTSAEATEVTP